jgi:transposase
MTVIRLLVRRFGDVTASRTRAACRLHAVLAELIPGGMPRKLKADQAAKVLRRVRSTDPVDQARRQLATDLIGEIRRHDRKLAEGKTKKEALRALKRRISDAVWRQLQVDLGRG